MNESFIGIYTAINFVIGIYATVAILRGVFTVSNADFYNPISQWVFTLTEPPLVIIRKIVPQISHFDPAPWVLAWLVYLSELLLIYILSDASITANLFVILQLATFITINAVLFVYMMVIFAWAISSWIAVTPLGGRPFVQSLFSLLNSVTAPILTPVRNFIPAMGVIDLSPMLVFISLAVLRNIIQSVYI